MLSGVLLPGLGARLAGADTPSRVFAAEVPGGAVRVLVVITDGRWPAGGLRVEDAGGTALVAHVPRDPTAYAALDARTQNTLAALQRIAAGSAPPDSSGGAIVALRMLSDWTVAQAAGMAVELPPGVHPKSVRVVLLKDSGEPMATLPAVPVTTDSGPAAPLGLQGEAKPSGISLKWQAGIGSTVPAYAYTVTRGDGSSTDVLTPHPQLLTSSKPGTPDPFVDRVPPVEATLNYQLRIVDALGVLSAAASVQIHSLDFAAGTPPAAQAAKGGRGVITLTWNPVDNPRTRGLVVERAQLVNGPYERLTPEGLSPQTTRFEDHEVFPGASYYYRVRAVTPGGELGAAGDPVRALALGLAAPAAPAGLAAEAGASRILLSWKAVPGLALAGYIVERRAGSPAPHWARLNARLLPEAHYVDVVGPGAGGSFEYRVTAVASDESVSAPSPVLSVELRDTTPPAPPTVLSVSGADGRVQIRFAAGAPAGKTAQVAMLRSERPSEAGLIVGAPVPGASGSIADDWVHGGKTYWYRLVAFDQAGIRSEESDAYQVRVGASLPPTPKAPAVIYTAAPVPAVKLSFEAPPPHVLVIVEVQGEDGRWKKVSGPSGGSSAADLNPPNAHAAYRIVYVSESGGMGVPSPAASPK